MKIVRFHVTGSTRESSAYYIDHDYKFFYTSDEDTLKSLKCAIKEFARTDEGQDLIDTRGTSGGYVTYDEALSKIPDEFLAKYGFYLAKFRIDENFELKAWDGLQI